MTVDRSLKKAVRARMAETGESYMAARRVLLQKAGLCGSCGGVSSSTCSDAYHMTPGGPVRKDGEP